jgi:hypothetical protein
MTPLPFTVASRLLSPLPGLTHGLSKLGVERLMPDFIVADPFIHRPAILIPGMHELIAIPHPARIE